MGKRFTLESLCRQLTEWVLEYNIVLSGTTLTQDVLR